MTPALGSPRHTSAHRVSPQQRGCEYSNAIAFHGPKILQQTTQNSVYPAEYAMEANDPTPSADIDQLDRVQRLGTRLVRALRHVPYEERLRQHNLFSLERRRLRANLILAFKIFKGEINLNPSDFIRHPPRAGLRGHTYRLLQRPSRLRRRNSAFSVRVVKYRNRL